MTRPPAHQHQPRLGVRSLLFALPTAASRAVLWIGLTLAGTAAAQYRVVGPDGRVTFTDRPPIEAPNTRVEPIRGGAAAAPAPGAGASPLPFDLQRVAQRFPVTLYTAKQCGACGEARNLLRQRGVPFAERTIDTDADTRAFAAINRDQTVPTLRVGGQVLPGFEASEWNGILNTAGYPTTSRLPANFQNAAPAPLAGQGDTGTARPSGTAPQAAQGQEADTGAAPGSALARRGPGGTAAAPPPPPAAPANPAGIRF